MSRLTNLIKDVYMFYLFTLANPTTDVVWREFRAIRRRSRNEITIEEAYKILYPTQPLRKEEQ